jgi:hypothetical protein
LCCSGVHASLILGLNGGGSEYAPLEKIFRDVPFPGTAVAFEKADYDVWRNRDGGARAALLALNSRKETSKQAVFARITFPQHLPVVLSLWILLGLNGGGNEYAPFEEIFRDVPFPRTAVAFEKADYDVRRNRDGGARAALLALNSR